VRRTPNTRRTQVVKLNTPIRKLVAAHATSELVVHLALLAPMDTMVSTDTLANRENVDKRPAAESLKPTNNNNANAQRRPVILEHKVHEVTQALQAILALQAPMVNQAALAQLAPQVQLAILATPAALVKQANPAELSLDALATLVIQDLMVNLVQLVILVNQADLAKMAALAALAQQAIWDQQVILANKAVQAFLAILVAMVLQAVANTAHRLVWLQVIKFRSKAQFSGNTEDRQKVDFIQKDHQYRLIFSPNAYPLVMSLLLNFYSLAFIFLKCIEKCDDV